MERVMEALKKSNKISYYFVQLSFMVAMLYTLIDLFFNHLMPFYVSILLVITYPLASLWVYKEQKRFRKEMWGE